jgi:hypothetical protein
MANLNFNCCQVSGDVQDMTPIPNGKYRSIISRTELGAANEKGTQQLQVEWEITDDGQYKGRKVRNWITVACPTSQTALDIGLRFYKNVHEAVGLASTTDTDELCAREHVIDVWTVADRNDKTKHYNEVKRCYPLSAASASTPPAGHPAAQQQTAPQQSAVAQPAGGGASAPLPPWARK